MSKIPQLLNQYGQPLSKSPIVNKPTALNGGWGHIPYDAADNTGIH
ncbi:unnamed protein product, partial [Commensalibacter papalotli (ex Botero et al. 2024)]